VAPTTKPYWSNAPVVAPIQAALGIPVGFDLDVTTAALGELQWGAGVRFATFGLLHHWDWNWGGDYRQRASVAVYDAPRSGASTPDAYRK
jgi:hypothetical protein